MKHLIGFLLMALVFTCGFITGRTQKPEGPVPLQFQAHLPELRSIYSATQAIER